MNDQTAKIIESLAAKLGTTTEYLWSVLLHQARVDGITTLCYLVLSVVSGIALFHYNKKWSNDDNDVSYYHNEYLIAPMVIIGVVWFILALYMVMSGVPTMITAFLNPEYWALDKILDAAK